MKKLLSILLAAVMVFSLAACGSSGGGGAASNTGKDTSGDSSAASGDTVKVGVLLPLSGSISYYGNVQLQGIQLCADYVNANGGIKALGGAKIELDVQDSASPRDWCVCV